MIDSQEDKEPDRIWFWLTLTAVLLAFSYYALILRIEENMASDDFVTHLFRAFIPYIFGHMGVESLPDRFGSLVYMFLVFPSSSTVMLVPPFLLKALGVPVLSAYFMTRVWLLLLTAVGAIPIFCIAKENRLAPFVSFMLALAFLMNPVLFLFPDHYETGYNFLFFLVFSLAVARKRFTFGLMALFVVVLSHPSSVLLAGGFIFVTMWKNERIWCRRYLLVCAGALAYYMVVFALLELTSEGNWDIFRHTAQLRALLDLLSGKGNLVMLLIAILVPLVQGFLLLLTMGFLPALSGKKLLGLLPSFLYMAIRDGGIFRGSLPADIGALATLSAQGLSRMPHRGRTVASVVCVICAFVTSLTIRDFMLRGTEETPLMRLYGIPYVTSKPNMTLETVRGTVREQKLKRVMVSIDLVPYFVDLDAEIRVLGLDDPGMPFDLVVISDRAEGMSERICDGMPPLRDKGLSANRVASDRQTLLSSGGYRLRRHEDGLVVLVPTGQVGGEG
jgi:hypothetical protein